jgi:hypothetical protein
MAVRGEIIGDDIANEIAPRLCGRGFGVHHASSSRCRRNAYVPNPRTRAKTIDPQNP